MQSLCFGRSSLMTARQGLNIQYQRTGSSLVKATRHRRRLPPLRKTGTVRNASTESKKGFFAWYTRQLDEKPLTTKIISSALIAASGDIICQILENNFAVDHGSSGNETTQQTATTSTSWQTTIDWLRTGRFFVIGAFWVAPATHLWYGFLSTRLIPGVATPKRVLQRLALHQFGAAPVFCPAFMGFLWLLEGKNPSEVKDDLIEAGPTLVTSNWKLWIPAMGVMFSVVPLKFHVLYSNFVGLVWTVYLSYASTRLASQPSEQQ